jgi:hypothetical protein
MIRGIGQAWRAIAVSLIAPVAVVACGVSTTIGTADTVDSNTGGGTSGTGGLQGNGGADPKPDSGDVSPGNAVIEFTVRGPGAYCGPACPGPPINVKDSEGQALTLAGSCMTDCSSCMPHSCISCPAIGVAVTGAKLDWDGTYYTTSTCVPAGAVGTNACRTPAHAKPGTYTATFCATHGILTGPDGGIQQCVTSGPPKCGSVEFDFPSSTVVKGTVGP